MMMTLQNRTGSDTESSACTVDFDAEAHHWKMSCWWVFVIYEFEGQRRTTFEMFGKPGERSIPRRLEDPSAGIGGTRRILD